MPEFLILILGRKYVIIKIKILSGNLRMLAIIGKFLLILFQRGTSSLISKVLSIQASSLDPSQNLFIFLYINGQNLMKSFTLCTDNQMIHYIWLIFFTKCVGSWDFPYRLTLDCCRSIYMVISGSGQNNYMLVIRANLTAPLFHSLSL